MTTRPRSHLGVSPPRMPGASEGSHCARPTFEGWGAVFLFLDFFCVRDLSILPCIYIRLRVVNQNYFITFVAVPSQLGPRGPLSCRSPVPVASSRFFGHFLFWSPPDAPRSPRIFPEPVLQAALDPCPRGGESQGLSTGHSGASWPPGPSAHTVTEYVCANPHDHTYLEPLLCAPSVSTLAEHKFTLMSQTCTQFYSFHDTLLPCLSASSLGNGGQCTPTTHHPLARLSSSPVHAAVLDLPSYHREEQLYGWRTVP